MVRTLNQYLALPVSEYSLLDPKAITRDPADEQLFCLAFPVGVLEDMFGLKLEPKIWVRVDSNPADASVRFSSERATLGDPRLDATFQLNMSSTLSSYGGERTSSFGKLRAMMQKPFWGRRKPDEEPALATLPADGAAGGPNIALTGGDAGLPAACGDDSATLSAQGHEENTEGGIDAGICRAGASEGSVAQGNDERSALGNAGVSGRVAVLAAQDANVIGRGLTVPGIETLTLVEAREVSSERAGQREEAVVGFLAEEGFSQTPAAGPSGSGGYPHGAGSAGAQGHEGFLAEQSQGLQSRNGAGAETSQVVEATLGEGKDRDGDGEGVGTQGLSCSVDIAMRFNMPAPFNAVPAPLLGTAGGLILKAILQAALPSFLQLLATDYVRWACQQDKEAPRDVGAAVGRLIT